MIYGLYKYTYIYIYMAYTYTGMTIYIYIYIYAVHSISFQTFFLQAFKIVVDS